MVLFYDLSSSHADPKQVSTLPKKTAKEDDDGDIDDGEDVPWLDDKVKNVHGAESTSRVTPF